MSPKKNYNKEYGQVLYNFALSSGYFITLLTQKIHDSFSANDLSRWMDNYYGGGDHRVYHGHDIAANLVDVYTNFGLQGVAQYPLELLKDFTTPHGIPIPGTQFAVENSILSPRVASHWSSLNVADALTGGLAIYGTYCLYKKTKDGKLDTSSLIWASIGISTKIGAGTICHNPILIVSGITDIAMVINSVTEANKVFNRLSNNVKSYIVSPNVRATSGGIGAALGVGAGSATLATSLFSAFGVASTGTAISSLSGAAATNATLAAIGGGSLASGGLGIAGGLAILSGGAAVAGLATGAGTYYYMRQKLDEKKKKVA